ncbi:MAG: chemotaxis protein CheB [Ferruginibacter sp.]
MEKDLSSGRKKVVVIGGSAGSLEVILYLLPKINLDLSIPIIIVIHRKASNDNLLTDLLNSKTKLLVKEAEEKEPLKNGCVYICPPNYHLLIEKDFTLSLDYSEKINFSRPSIDVTFQSAADVFKENTVCILLSGGNNDGTNGLIFTKRKGGKTIVQNPENSEVPYMPQHAILNNCVDLVFNKEELTTYINSL